MPPRFFGSMLIGPLLSSCGGSGSAAGAEAAFTANTLPTISRAGETSLIEKTTQVMFVSARDAHGDTLRFSLRSDDAQLLSIDEDSALGFAIAPDFEAPADTDGDKICVISVRVSDGSSDADLAVTVTVTNDPANDFQLAASGFITGTAVPLIHACAEQGGNNYSPQLG